MAIAFSTTLMCPNAFDCRAGLIQNDTIRLYGYKSASGPNTTIHCTLDRCDCMGAFSCHNVRNISFPLEILCYGIHSCSNLNPQGYITSNKQSSKLWCTGANSCSYSIIQATKSNNIYILHCQGFLSCAYSQISGVSSIQAPGAYSLQNVTISSEGITGNSLQINLDGYNAGLYAHIVCQSNHECNIWCSPNGCNISHLHCIGNCTFSSQGNDDLDPTISAHTDALYHFLKDITAKHDEQCSNTSMSVTFDDTDSFTPFANSQVNVCCRARDSCVSNNSLHINATQRLIASASYSFMDGILNAVGPLFCSGDRSCIRSNITTASDIYCLAGNSCEEVNIADIRGDIMCFGQYSCWNSVIHTSGTGKQYHFYFVGMRSAQGATIYCKKNDECIVACLGRVSCLSTTLICDGICDIQCNKYSHCPVVQSQQPTLPSSEPTSNPTAYPTTFPTLTTVTPTTYPTLNPTVYPTASPTTFNPTEYPTFNPFARVSNTTVSDDDKETGTQSMSLALFYCVIAIVAVVSVVGCICIWNCFVRSRKRHASDDIQILSETTTKHASDDIQPISEMTIKQVDDTCKAGSIEEHRVTDEGLGDPQGPELCVEDSRGEGSMSYRDVQNTTNITEGNEFENVQADEFVIQGDEYDTIQ
eukprot:14800_1